MYLLLTLLHFAASQRNYPNCEPLSPGLTVRWEVDEVLKGIYFNLTSGTVSGKGIGSVLSSTGGWIAFGISKTQSREATMIGSDVTVAYHDGSKVEIEDYFLKSKQECDLQSRDGVCPDDVFGGSRDLINSKGTFVEGQLSATYFKFVSLRPSDLPSGLSTLRMLMIIQLTSLRTHLSWLPLVSCQKVVQHVGSPVTLTGTGRPAQHGTTPDTSLQIHFGRIPRNNCENNSLSPQPDLNQLVTSHRLAKF
jgi:hypothetical protein